MDQQSNNTETMSLIKEYQQLLRDLKIIVESLLISGVANVWNVYGGLNRLHTTVENIFKHQCKTSNSDGNIDCWSFILGLNWLQPDVTNSTLFVDSEYQPHLPSHLKTDKVSLWLYRSLENHSLSQKLSWLLTDKEHILTCYNSNAFMCQEKYTEATLICLRAVERSEPSLLSDIDPCLFLNSYGTKNFHKIHRRCSSFPDATNFRSILIKKPFNQSTDVCDSQRTCKKILEKSNESNINSNRISNNNSNINNSNRKFCGKLKPWRSLPNLQLENVKIRRRSATIVKHYSSTTPSSPIKVDEIKLNEKLSPSMLKVDYTNTDDHRKRRRPLDKTSSSRKHTRTKDISGDTLLSSSVINLRDKTSRFENMSTKSLPCRSYKSEKFNTALELVRSAPDYTFSILPGEKDYKKRPPKSFIEDGGNSVLPMSIGFFPRPSKGQSLTSFLTSGQFSRANAELDRENAHFSISEAMIAVIEQIKWKRNLKLDDEHVEESDEEINNLKQRIRLRRRQKQLEKQKLWSASLLSDGKTDTTTTEASASVISTSPDTDTDSPSSEGVDDLEIDEASNLSEQKGLSMSMASLYIEGDLLKQPRGAPDGQSDILSAEGVALSLIRRFSEKQLPRASELEWLISEQDVPEQTMLPMPKSWPVNPEEYTSLRGTSEWAPPRPQIIFTIHPSPVRKILIAKQNYRCAGCGMKVVPKYASRFRYCDYLGRYFCTGCHTNQLALIPGRILQKWDFNRYTVSSFSYRLLEQMYNDPLFPVMKLNPILLRKSRNLEKSIKLRLQLSYLKEFIILCRFAEDVQNDVLQDELPYILTDPEIYSLSDLVQIKNGDFVTHIKYLVDTCTKHVLNCQLCSARGFLCEICKSMETIYPWQLEKVTRCNKCGACFHINCRNNKNEPCSRCNRIENRVTKQESITTVKPAQ